MTVSVTDLPVAPTARPKVYVPVARPQSPHTAPAASAGQGSEDTATSESDGDGTQGQ
jgi:hypothetical protein